MEKITECLLCKGKHLSNLLVSKDYLVSKKDFTVVKCDTCGFVFTNPRPGADELGGFYQSEEYISHHDQGSNFMDRVYRAVRHYMLHRKVSVIRSNIRKHPTGIKLLDYGCATGEFLLRAKSKGIATMGFEPDGAAREKARRKGVTVVEKTEDLLDNDSLGRFDVITLWHVLEHIPDLDAVKLLFQKLLNPDGLLVVAVPEYKSFDARFYKEDWAAWDLPRHLNHFEKDTLLQLFGDTFLLEKVYPLVFDSFYVSLLSEKNKQSGFAGFLRAIGVGLWSNILFFAGKHPCSSQIYVFRKK